MTLPTQRMISAPSMISYRCPSSGILSRSSLVNGRLGGQPTEWSRGKLVTAPMVPPSIGHTYKVHRPARTWPKLSTAPIDQIWALGGQATYTRVS